MTDYTVLFTWETAAGAVRDYIRVIAAYDEQDAMRRLREDLTDFVWRSRRELRVMPATAIDVMYAKFGGQYIGDDNG